MVVSETADELGDLLDFDGWKQASGDKRRNGSLRNSASIRGDKPKYIEKLLKTAERRQKEQDLVYERYAGFYDIGPLVMLVQ